MVTLSTTPTIITLRNGAGGYNALARNVVEFEIITLRNGAGGYNLFNEKLLVSSFKRPYYFEGFFSK